MARRKKLGPRVPVEINPIVREELRDLLMSTYSGTGVGYSAFILAAIEWARVNPGLAVKNGKLAQDVVNQYDKAVKE